MIVLLRSSTKMLRFAFWMLLVVGLPLVLAFEVLGLNHWNLSIPWDYNKGDATWQFMLTKTLLDTGWVLTNPYLGAPNIAQFYNNAAAQTSALHSVLMLALSPFIHNAVRLQQIYYLLNFPLISLTSFVACRLLGIARLPAVATGLLYAFTPFRFGFLIYAFLPNYFMVPLALVPVIWILSGRFTAFFDESKVFAGPWYRLMRVLRSRDFILGLVFVLLMAVSDGYYAFFTLLLLGFAVFSRAVIGDWRRPLALVPAGVYIVAMLGTALALQWPLHEYKETHHSEFYPHGVQDPSLAKHPFEAEVYSTSLKMMVAPIPNHRIAAVGAFGDRAVQTNDAARQFKVGKAAVPLGTLDSLLFGVALILIAIPAARRAVVSRISAADGGTDSRASPGALPDALLSLTLFIFLCSIFGGIGPLIALVFPTIRAYDRFPIFLIFVLYLGAAWVITHKLRGAGKLGRRAWAGLLLGVTAAALYDQIPNDASQGSAAVKAEFLAEGRFVRQVEAALPPDAMVYQFPYSQYLRDSKYYGWGSWGSVRLYLHSHDLRWSNGGAKNSPADDWDYFVSQLPPNAMITEVEAAGFKGFVIDRTVVKPPEYQAFRNTFLARGADIFDDAASKLVFVKLRDPGYRLAYDHSYKEADSIVVTDPARLLAQTEFSRYVNADALKRFVASHDGKAAMVIRRAEQPELFVDMAALARGMGQTAIKPITDMRGQMACKVETRPGSSTILLTIENQSKFDWQFGGGGLPIGIGVHILQPDGKLLRWDNGFRVPTGAYVRRGASDTIRLPLNAVPLGADVVGHGPLAAEFALVQDGNAWFGSVNCTVPLQ